jgi:hypothetical protein
MRRSSSAFFSRNSLTVAVSVLFAGESERSGTALFFFFVIFVMAVG